MIDFTKNYVLTINGKSETSLQTFQVVNPATEEVITEVPEATREQLDTAIAAAQAAFPSWSSRSLEERQKAVAAIGDIIEKHGDDFKRLLTREQGKPRSGADWEIDGTVYWCREIATQSLPVELVENSAAHRIETHRVPIGVIGAITPWNFPVLLAIWKIAPALLAGNTMVLKPSPFTPLCTLKLGELMQKVLPAGVLNVLSGSDDFGKWMTEHPSISKISFTGSTDTGKKIMQSASGNLKRITLELGGNDPAVVLPDVDPKAVVKDLFWSAFQNSAQFCVAAKRMYIHEDIYDDLSAALVEYAATVQMGDGSEQGTDLGPIQNKMQYEKLCMLLEDARNSGLKFLTGGTPEHRNGYFIPVTIIDNPPDNARVVTEEAFGPVLPLLKFRDLADVVKRANDTPYGLAASVWSSDEEKATALAHQLECGTVWINEAHVFSPHVAFGGHKQSGVGIENAQDGLLEYTNAKTIMVRHKAE